MNKTTKGLLLAYRRGYRVNNKGILLNPKNKIIKGNINSYGYKRTTIHKKNDSGDGRISYQVYFHRLQAYQKYGHEIFKDGIVVRHLNGISTDNSLDNIVLGNSRDNIMDRSVECRRKGASSPKYNHKKILEDRKKGLTYKELMLKYNISSKGTLSFIINKSMKKENCNK